MQRAGPHPATQYIYRPEHVLKLLTQFLWYEVHYHPYLTGVQGRRGSYSFLPLLLCIFLTMKGGPMGEGWELEQLDEWDGVTYADAKCPECMEGNDET